MKTRRFEARILLTVTTGRLLTRARGECDNGISDLYELLGWITNDEPFTHQLPRFAETCKPFLLEWFPELNTFDLHAFDESRCNKDGMEQFILDWQANNRTWYDVPKIPNGSHKLIDPIAELVGTIGKPIAIISTAASKGKAT